MNRYDHSLNNMRAKRIIELKAEQEALIAPLRQFGFSALSVADNERIQAIGLEMNKLERKIKQTLDREYDDHYR